MLGMPLVNCHLLILPIEDLAYLYQHLFGYVDPTCCWLVHLLLVQPCHPCTHTHIWRTVHKCPIKFCQGLPPFMPTSSVCPLSHPHSPSESILSKLNLLSKLTSSSQSHWLFLTR